MRLEVVLLGEPVLAQTLFHPRVIIELPVTLLGCKRRARETKKIFKKIS